MSYEFTLTTQLSAFPHEVYEAWLSSEHHTAMTGGVAHIHAEAGTVFDTWDGYITGKIIELDPPHRICQTWRTAHFSKDDPDSEVEILLQAEDDSTLLTLNHSNVPDGQTNYEESGWRQFDFEPMKRRFEWLRLKETI